MDDMNHKDHQASAPHAGHNMSDVQGIHDHHAGHSVAMFRDKFWLSLTLTIPVVFWSTDVQHWLGYESPSFPPAGSAPPHLRHSRFRVVDQPLGLAQILRTV